jgi:hypothetical protein
MKSTLEQINQSLEDNLKCKKVKSEIISYHTDNKLKKEIRNKKFDFVIRDLSDEIIALGDYILNDSDIVGYQDLINGEASGITYPVFYVNKGGWFILVNGSRVDIDLNLEDWLYADEFCPFLQDKYPSTKRDIDNENLNNEVLLLRNRLEEAHLEIKKIKEDKEKSLEFYKEKINNLEAFIFKISTNITQAQKNTIKNIIEEMEKLKKLNAVPFPEAGWNINLDLYQRKPYFNKLENGRVIVGREIITNWSSDGQFPTWSFDLIAVVDKNGLIVSKEDYTDEENLAPQSFGGKDWISCKDLINTMSTDTTEGNNQNKD